MGKGGGHDLSRRAAFRGAVGAVLMGFAVSTAAHAGGGFKTGEDLMRQYNLGPEGRAEQAAYIVGVLDGERIVSTVAKFKSPICLPGGVPTQHISLVVHEWLESHPERLGQQAANLVLTAVKERVPCR